MKDNLLDLVQHTFDLGCIDLIKVTGTDAATAVNGLAADNSVIVEAQFANPVADFIGTFGMPNLGKLKTLINLQEYKEDAKLTITRRTTGEPDGINFENKAGDFRNNYRFMASEVVNDKLKTLKFKGVNWHITFEPTVAAIQRLKMQWQANSEETNFQVKVELEVTTSANRSIEIKFLILFNNVFNFYEYISYIITQCIHENN
jgi:hypothetical protein